MKQYSKAIAAFVGSGAGTYITAAQDGGVSGDEWGLVVATALVTTAGVFGFRNTAKYGEPV